MKGFIVIDMKGIWNMYRIGMFCKNMARCGLYSYLIKHYPDPWSVAN